MSVEPKQVDLKQQFRAMAQGSQSLAVAYIGVVNGLFASLKRLGQADADALASAAGMDAAYVRRWCDAAYAFLYLDSEDDMFRLAESGAAMVPDAPGTLMPIAVQAMLNMHMAERAAALMRTGERPGEQVMGERETLLPWFGPMLEASFPNFSSRRSARMFRSSPRSMRAADWSLISDAATAGICARSPAAAAPSVVWDWMGSTRISPRRPASPPPRDLATGFASPAATPTRSASKPPPTSSP